MRLVDPGAIRRILETDRVWSAYAIADLAPAAFGRCDWYGTEEPPALALLYRAFSVPVLLAVGGEGELAPVLAALPEEEALYLAVPSFVPRLLAPRYERLEVKSMLRMVLPPAALLPASDPRVERLGMRDASAVARLYRDGEATGESPEFFGTEMLASGAFHGIRAAGELVAVAGTHVLKPELGVAAIGNVYVRRDSRGRSLGTLVTCATAHDLRQRGIPTIVLNVGESNVAARRSYERLGFGVHMPYVEGRLRLKLL